ncbi:hypothetical protein GCM10025857_35550 [Alicyclobacillus contaminans]|uniref:hypothetical protein n=1 Tax=Alicyclobacillus contaminans TaxID=392016 RepID=UPI0003FCC880|nr:hypothetical protein [Alicyclobacillus contaminans]GMA52198.1 hypothetical protein GCM10025857_35550 [Alicyclobacillus contaminans]
MNIRIPVTGPLDFRQSMRRPLSRPTRLAQIPPDGAAYTRVLRSAGESIPVTIRLEDGVDAAFLVVELPDGVSAAQQRDVA